MNQQIKNTVLSEVEMLKHIICYQADPQVLANTCQFHQVHNHIYHGKITTMTVCTVHRMYTGSSL